MGNKHAPGATQADLTRPSIATLPYEIQVAIFEAAMDPQIFFVDITNNHRTFTRPAAKALGLACLLSREVYIKSKTLHMFGQRYHWVDPDRDIFYLRKDDPVPRTHRPTDQETNLPRAEGFDASAVRNVAVDLLYLGDHPRHDPVIRLWTLFPEMRAIHVFVPKGPPQTPVPRATPDTLVLSAIPSNQIVAAPGHDRELWLAVRYQVKKVCARILDNENGWRGRVHPEVAGHLTSLRPTQTQTQTQTEMQTKSADRDGR
jgi:hypothetical protein